MKKTQMGTLLGKRTLITTELKSVEIPDAQDIVHLQFRRFAGCPFCSVHLQSFSRRYEEIVAAGIKEVVVFRSTAAALRRYQAVRPFAIVADPNNLLYTEFGVGFGLRALLNPRVLVMALPNIIRQFPRLPGIPPGSKGALGFPADFLIATDGRVLACKYGSHADDQWSVDDLLSLAHQPAAR